MNIMRYCSGCGSELVGVEICVPFSKEENRVFSQSLVDKLEVLSFIKCNVCKSLIASDIRSNQSLLETSYANLKTAYWSNLCHRSGLGERLLGLLPDHPILDVWDIGCGTGDLLNEMPSFWNKYGIEPGEQAVDLGRKSGLELEVGTASGLGKKNVADLVFAIDVLEHLHSARLELAAMADMIRPGGILVALTGRADSWAARLAGKNWYYLQLVGHVTILSGKALRNLVEDSGLEIITQRRFEHEGAVSGKKWFARFLKNQVKAVLGRKKAPLLYYRDHQLVIARKTSDFSNRRDQF